MLRYLIAATLALLFSLSAGAQPATKRKTDSTYYGIFLKDAKLGYMVQERDDAARYAGKVAVKLTVHTVMNIGMLGASSTILTDAAVYMDPKTGATLAEESKTEASGRVTTVKATYTSRSVSFTADIQGAKKSGTLTLKPGETFLRDPSDTPGQKPVPGSKTTGKAFSSDTQTLIDMEVLVGERELITVGGKSVMAYKMQSLGLIPSTTFVDDSGGLLLSRVALGIEIRRMPREQALAASTKNVDLADSVGVRPTGESLEKSARGSQTAIYELGQVTRPLPPNNSVQGWEELVVPQAEKNIKTLKVTIRANPLPTGPTVAVFAKPERAPERLRPFLKDTIYVPSTESSFVALAKKVIGTETDSAKVAALLATHTHKTIKPDPSIAATRTAHDIRKDPRGVCRDFTTYFTTLARAVGLPTKQCTGLAYANGLFLYHAWPEVFVGIDASGKDLWIALEPTWGMPFADATHLKLTEGEITDVTKIAADMENYTINVISVTVGSRE